MMNSDSKESEASFAEQGAGKPAQSIECGVQPLDKIMEERGLKNHDLVAASKDGLTHKQVQKGRRGRRLTRNIQDKVAAALSAVTKEMYKVDQLFNYR
jgi:hypothetical protein